MDFKQLKINWGSPRGVEANELNCGIRISEFEPQFSYYIYFPTNTLRKVWTPLHLNYVLNSTTSVLLQWRPWLYITHKCWYIIKQKIQKQ